ncbi:MAG TPA: cobalamin-independent methionine synthase II family protein [Gaiellaceae bacterium]|nr:cobalamin-independent methionine synthase II family protein [Gaiellaceae bacterium]
MAFSYKFHADHVGSLLRPPALLEARRRLEAGMIDPEELRAVEDEAIAAAVKMQREAGFDIYTDGEFRRTDFRSVFADAFDGIESHFVEMPWRGPTGTVTLPSLQYTITGRLQQRRRMTEGDVAYLRSLTRKHIKVTLLAPGFVAERFWQDGVTDQVYESREELGAEIAAATRNEIEALFAEGVIYVQLDNPGYSAFLGSHARTNGHGGDPASLERMLAVDAAAVDGVERTEAGSIALHVCRGNQASLWLAEGGYEAVAEKLFNLPVDRFLLEYDDDRAGSMEPLRYMPKEKTVALGLISTKSPELEPVEELQQRIDEAAQHIELDNLAVSPQCGFASVAEGGNKITPEEQYEKLRRVTDTAFATWGFEA